LQHLRSLKRTSLFSLVLLCLLTPTWGANGAELLMFESETCGWCDRWREEIGPIYPKTNEGKRAPLRAISIHEPRPVAYRSINGIVYTPTFVLWNTGA